MTVDMTADASGQGRVVIVTGASGGVGEGIALACARKGWTVWIAARRRQEGEAVAARVDELGGQGRFHPCDAADPDSVAACVAAAVERDGGLDAVIHNATSGLSSKPVDAVEVSVEDYLDHVAVSLRGAYLLASNAFPHLVERSGALLLLTSEAAFEGKAALAAYGSVKAGLRGLARSLAREWGPHGARVNCLGPLAKSPAMERAIGLDASVHERIFGRHPMGRLGEPEEDVGTVAQFLISREAQYLTGQTVMADGGSCFIV